MPSPHVYTTRNTFLTKMSTGWITRPILLTRMTQDLVIDLLQMASGYEHGLKHLNSQQKILVEKLKELGGSIKKVVGSKRKCMCISMSSHLQFPSTYNSYQLF
jgi:hypothetical protein